MRMRLAVATIALVAGAVVPASASSSRAVPTVTLAGRVTMTGSSSWVRVVTLPQAVKVSFSDVAVGTGRGRFRGFVLKKDGKRDIDGQTPFASSIASGGCVTRACTPDAPTLAHGGAQNVYPSTQAEPFAAVLPAGRYHLYFVADGAPATATLYLHGLRGQVTISGGAPAAVTMATPAPDSLGPQTPAGNLGQVYSAGVSHQIGPGDAYLFFHQWKLMYGPPTYNHVGFCNYIGPPATTPLGYHYQAPCSTDLSSMDVGRPDGGFNTGRHTGPSGLFAEYETEYFGYGPCGCAGQYISTGGFTNTPDIATEAKTLVLFVDFVKTS